MGALQNTEVNSANFKLFLARFISMPQRRRFVCFSTFFCSRSSIRGWFFKLFPLQMAFFPVRRHQNDWLYLPIIFISQFVTWSPELICAPSSIGWALVTSFDNLEFFPYRQNVCWGTSIKRKEDSLVLQQQKFLAFILSLGRSHAINYLGARNNWSWRRADQ